MNMMCTLVCLISLFSAVDAAVNNIQAVDRQGKVYVTFSEESGSDKTYNVYRSTSKITNVSGLTPMATLSDQSNRDPYHNWQHIIEDGAAPLSDSTGLFVYTPKSNAHAYYAVTTVHSGVENSTIVLGQNSLNTAVSEKYQKWPGAIYRGLMSPSGVEVEVYYYWMDYNDWNHAAEYYGNYFSARYPSSLQGQQNNILVTDVHSAGGASDPGKVVLPPNVSGAVIIGTSDTYRNNSVYEKFETSWKGYTDHYIEHEPQAGDVVVMYTEMRVAHYTQAVINNPHFGIDPNRVYLRGSSMGGGGTAQIGLHFSDIWASCRANGASFNQGNSQPRDWSMLEGSPIMVPGISSSAYKFRGDRDLGLVERDSGHLSFDMYDVSWMARNLLDRDFPPFINTHGTKDYKYNMRMNRNVYYSFQETRRGIWGEWVNEGHGRGPYGYDVVPGGYLRFVKNEVYPALSYASQDDDYGQFDDDARLFVALSGEDDPLVFDNAGTMNGYIDWTSSLHDMGLSNDDLIDTAAMLVITMKSSRANTTADVTPRRVQHFIIQAGSLYDWKNEAVQGGAVIQSGSVVADQYGRVTVPGFQISQTGSRLIITAYSGSLNADITAPTVPQNLSATSGPEASTLMYLSWNASTDPTVSGRMTSTVAYYEIRRNGVLIATTPNTSFIDGVYDENMTYSYEVRAYDRAENQSGWSASASAVPTGGSGGGDDGGGLPANELPVAVAAANVLEGTAPLTVNFNSNGSYDN
ncbi:MAG: hypothetical protein HRU15_02370, partial [Planctomycetes bacterium]|nr:hypothetical protein [Planctomycetota bacterium]